MYDLSGRAQNDRSDELMSFELNVAWGPILVQTIEFSKVYTSDALTALHCLTTYKIDISLLITSIIIHFI